MPGIVGEMASLMRKTKAELVEMLHERDATIIELEEQIADRDARLKEWTDEPGGLPPGTTVEIEVLNPARLLAFGALMAGFISVLYLISSNR